MEKTKEQKPVGELRESLKSNGVESFGNSILENIEDYGLGTMSKTDLEAFILYTLMVSIDDSKINDMYDWMRILKITQNKYKSLYQIISAKYRNLDLNNIENWELLARKMMIKKIEIEDSKKGTIRFYLDDVHLRNFIERFCSNNETTLDYTLNKNQIVLKYDMFLLLIDKIIKITKLEKLYLEELNSDRGAHLIDKKINSVETFFSNFKTDFYENSAKENTKDVLEFVAKSFYNVVKKRIIG